MSVDVILVIGELAEERIGRPRTLRGVARLLEVDPDSGAYRHRGPYWRIVVRGSRAALLEIGAIDHCGLLLKDELGRVIAPCEDTDRSNP